MNILRRLGLAVLAVVLFLSLLSTAWSHIAVTTLGNRATVKTWLNESGFYDHIVESVLDNVNKNSEADEGGGESNQQIPVDDPQVQAVVATAFSPDFLRENVEKVLDGTYSWLEGDTAKPEFMIDLTEAKQRLADGLGNYAATRAASLPVCTPEQTAALTSSGFDSLSAPCLPPGVDPQAAGAEIRNEIMTNEDFLKQTSFSGDDIKVTSEGQEVAVDQAEEFRRVQQSYKLATYWPYGAALVAILSAVGVIFLSATRRKGIRRAGIILLVAGIFLGISYSGFTQLSNWANKQALDVGGSSTVSEELIRNVLGVISDDITTLLLWYALGFGLVGLIAILLTIFVGKSKQPTEPVHKDPVPPVDDSPKQDPAKKPIEASKPATTAPPVAPKKKAPRKIQL